MSNSERMTPVDTTWLRMDRPANPMVVLGVLILAGPVDAARLQAVLAERLLATARFRQRHAVEVPTDVGDDAVLVRAQHELPTRRGGPLGEEVDGLVVGIIRHGYRIGDEVLRPAAVAVGKA